MATSSRLKIKIPVEEVIALLPQYNIPVRGDILTKEYILSVGAFYSDFCIHFKELIDLLKSKGALETVLINNSDFNEAYNTFNRINQLYILLPKLITDLKLLHFMSIELVLETPSCRNYSDSFIKKVRELKELFNTYPQFIREAIEIISTLLPDEGDETLLETLKLILPKEG